MIEHTLDTEHSILYLHPTSSIEQNDFVELAKIIDPYIEKAGDLSGIIIEVASFPGWENLSTMITHFRFVKEHHRHVKKLGLVTDSVLANIVEHLGSHFVAAEIRHFPAGEFEAAKQWIISGS